ncbi:type II toxin-antitoxin system RelE/ParE family toxin [Caballeronia mineralivorans]|uniref:type II toxin-antitoxin system RelE/ParE family toxin n=1 Tax=Caballeronia mineralivorans TaxID=2010198 RepID=UPI0023F3B79E|nr:type II toxin-antitoxin system RelE/ParE family toxin [Caballeronia mineralivorans]MDB5782202.1 addiction module toxin, RelE/StbE family [Caballeronia mineralivorans]
MIVEWREMAREERIGLFDYIAEDNPSAALELDDKIARQTDALPEHPELYKPGRVRGTREMVLTSNYVLVYRIKKQAGVIEIVRIIGARQRYPKGKRKS